jgi:hypothetical protein
MQAKDRVSLTVRKIPPPLAFKSSSVASEELTTEGVSIDEASTRLEELKVADRAISF